MSFFAKRRVAIHIAVYAVGFAILSKFLPFVWFLPVAVVLALAHYWVVSRSRRDRYRTIIEGARAAHIESVPTPQEVRSRDVDDLLFDTLKDVTAELEDKYYQLVEKNIQLLSLKEISLTIISSLNEARIVDSVHGFLVKGLGFKEVFVGIISQETREPPSVHVQGGVWRGSAGGHNRLARGYPRVSPEIDRHPQTGSDARRRYAPHRERSRDVRSSPTAPRSPTS